MRVIQRCDEWSAVMEEAVGETDHCEAGSASVSVAVQEMTAPHLDFTIEQDDIQAGAINILTHIRPQWKLDHVNFKVFTDGITNKLIGCFNSDCSSDVILVRVYGPKTDLLIDRRAETENIKFLQGVGFTPPLFATFNNGLAYQYIPGEVLTVDTVRSVDVYPLVARKMAQLHKVHTPSTHHKPALWPKIEQFVSLVPEQYSPMEKQQRYVSLVAGGLETLRQELNQLRSSLSLIGSPVVFCHNDLLLANVIHRPGAVNFIDYEYAAFNYQAYDIGNHFDEFAGVADVDFSRYPDEEFQLAWLRVYLTEYKDREPTDLELRTLYIQVNKFALAAHYLWGLWSLVQAEHSNIDFDFLEYAGLRLSEYFAKKESLLALEIPRIDPILANVLSCFPMVVFMSDSTMAILLCLASLLLCSAAADEISGPYNLRVLNVTDCGKEGPEQIHFNVTCKSVNETTNIFNGQVTLPKPFNDDTEMSMVINQWQNETMKEIYSSKFKKMCTGMKELMKEPFTEMTSYLKIENKCPIPANTYNFKGFVVTLKPSITRAPFGTYRADMKAHKDNIITGCAEVYFIVTPMST